MYKNGRIYGKKIKRNEKYMNCRKKEKKERKYAKSEKKKGTA